MSEPRYPYVHIDVAPDAVDELSATLWELGAEGIEERDAGTLAKGAAEGNVTLVASFESRELAEEAIAALAPEHAARYEEVVGDAWRDAWKAHYRPFVIARTERGRAIVIRPPWEAYEPNEGDVVLELEPGRAFGTGLHETTRLVAQALAEQEQEIASCTLFDIGCGSGVLALVALALGASRAIAVDIDADSIEVTRENAERNHLSHRIEASTTPIESVSGTAPVVVANIEARVLIPMATELDKRVAQGGLLLLSGILVPQAEEVRQAYPGFELLSQPIMGEWTLLCLRKRGG